MKNFNREEKAILREFDFNVQNLKFKPLILFIINQIDTSTDLQKEKVERLKNEVKKRFPTYCWKTGEKL